MAFTPESGDALVVVDVQRDFCPGGAWPSPTATRSCRSSTGSRRLSTVVTTHDSHPPDHSSFAARRPLARPLRRGHARLGPHPDLKLDPHHQVFKGRDREVDGYSGWTPSWPTSWQAGHHPGGGGRARPRLLRAGDRPGRPRRRLRGGS